MKKTLVSALTTALVVGAASTTFAAANPFSDVPADHWAYDAVTQLAADGVIEGYGDTTFRGQQNITRYEMAQMIAKAMARTDVSASDKALIDKLAAEFSDELGNLGVRVSNLERNADMVKWNGQARYRYWSQRYENEKGSKDKKNKDQLNFRLEPSAEVNNNWHVKARIDANTRLDTDKGEDTKGNSTDKLDLKRIWAEGHYGANRIMLGKFEMPDPDTITDTPFSGAEYSYQPAGDGVSFVVGAGRFSADSNGSGIMGTAQANGSTDTANVQYVGVGFQKSKLNGAARYYHADADYFNTETNTTSSIAYAKSKEDTANIWELKGGYRFDKNWGFKGFYSQNTEADYFDKAGSAEIDYKGAQAENAGTYGLWVAYRHLSRNAVLASPFDVINTWNSVGQKGWEIGGNYALFQNTILTLRYGDGEELAGGKDVKNLFGRVNFFF
jgi:hypothetical protein